MYGRLPHVSGGEHIIGGKQKCESEDSMDIEEAPYVSKTAPTTLQAGFQVLHVLLSILPGSLFVQVSPIIVTIKVFTLSLLVLVTILLKSLGEYHPCVASETFCTFSTLLKVMCPVKSGDWLERVYDCAIQRLSMTDTDAEVCRVGHGVVEEEWQGQKDGIVHCVGYTGLKGAALNLLLLFFSALVTADDQIAMHVVPRLVIAVQKSSRKGDANPMHMAKCIGEVVRSQQGVTIGMIAEYSKYIKVANNCLTSLAEFKSEDIKCGAEFTHSWRVGVIHMSSLSRLIFDVAGDAHTHQLSDMHPQQDVFNNVINHFSSEEEGVGTAIAFSAGAYPMPAHGLSIFSRKDAPSWGIFHR
ncbi:hypothetical protein EDC04DRAFT_2610523 [Pisolithus marmoratus]|nr:hypothetical protein EDC04DRAFT_2610523 [Pisolithus marmoratus]